MSGPPRAGRQLELTHLARRPWQTLGHCASAGRRDEGIVSSAAIDFSLSRFCIWSRASMRACAQGRMVGRSRPRVGATYLPTLGLSAAPAAKTYLPTLGYLPVSGLRPPSAAPLALVSYQRAEDPITRDLHATTNNESSATSDSIHNTGCKRTNRTPRSGTGDARSLVLQVACSHHQYHGR